MKRRSWWLLAASTVVCVLAARVVWLGWLYYFHAGPRYRLESAAIALVIVGAIVLLARTSKPGLAFGVVEAGQIPSEPSESPGSLEPLSLQWLPVFLVAALTLYSPALGLGLLSDDYTLRAMAQSDGLGAGSGWFFRPLPLLLWRALLAIDNSGVLLHIVNVLLHGLNAFLVATLGRTMGMRRSVALGGAVLFLTFPAAPEAVVWAAGLQDVLMTTMALGAVVAARAVAPSGRRIAAIVLLAVLGLGSKETAICILALVAICWISPSRFRRWQEWRPYVALLVVTGIYLAIRVPMGLSSGYLAAPSRYFFKQLIVTAYGTLTTPWRAPASPMEQWLSFLAMALLVLLLVHAFLSWRRGDARLHRDIRLACWVLLAVAPVFTFFFISPQLEGSRYLYLAECGWALLAADLIVAMTDRLPRQSLAFGCAIASAVLVSVLSVAREVGVWTQAADLRDRVLADARASIARQGCVEATFTGVPDSVDGAYVFRNGFPEAMEPARVRLPPSRAQRASASPAEAFGGGGKDTTSNPDTTSAPTACEFMWRDGRFIAVQP
jgi:hypothetical protein